MRFVLILAALFALAAPVAAGESTAIVRVRIVGYSSAQPLSLDINSHALGVRARTTPIGAAGLAVIRGLPAGTYDVRVVSAGHSVASSSVDLQAGDDVSLEADLRVPTAPMHVTDKVRDGAEVDFSRADLAVLPFGGTIAAIVDNAYPFAVVDRTDNGGLTLGMTTHIGAHGASWKTTAFSVDDLDVTNPARPGEPMMVFDPGVADAVTIASGAQPVDVRGPGLVAGLVLRRPGTLRQASVDGSFTSPALVASSMPADSGAPPIASLRSFGDAGVQFGEPVDDHTGIVVAGRVSHATQIDRGDPAVLDVTTESVAGHVVRQLNAHDELRVFGGYQHLDKPFDDRAMFQTPDGVTESDGFVQALATWERVTNAGARWVVSGGVVSANANPSVMAGMAGGTIDSVLDGQVPSPAAQTGVSRTEARIEYAPPPRKIGALTHTFEFGATASHSVFSADVLATPVVAELVDGLPARVWEFTAPAGGDRRGLHDLAAYASDRLTLARLTVDAGVRLEFSGGSADGAAVGIGWRTLAPRVALRTAVTPTLTVFGGYARYHPMLTFDLAAFGDPAAPSAQVYRWTDPNGDGQFQPSEQGALISRVGPAASIASIDPALRSPYTDEVTFGAEQQWGRSTFRVTGTVRRESALVGSVDVGVPMSDYQAVLVADTQPDLVNPDGNRLVTVYNRLPTSFGADQYLLTNPAGASATYRGFELGFDRRADRFRVSLAASAFESIGGAANRGASSAENDQDVIGEEFADPNAAINAQGRLFFDRAYMLKWTTTYVGPREILVSAIARYEDGQPFSRFVIAPNLSQGPEAVMAYTNGLTRFTFLATLDVHVEKSLTVRGRRTAVTIDAFNLLNAADEVEENVVGGVGFRSTTFIQPPRVIRLGMRFEF